MIESVALSLGDAIPLADGRRYLLRSVIRSGRSGIVYRAESEVPGGPPLAIKVPRPELGEDLVRRLVSEGAFLARFGAQLQSRPGAGSVPRVYGQGKPPVRVYLAMDLVTSPNGEQLLIRGGLTDETELASFGSQILTLLAVLHDDGKTYLDFKLENLHWNAEERRLVVIDWNEVGDADDANGPRRDVLQAMAYLHGLATGAVLPIQGLALVGPVDRSARWSRLSPFARFIFETAFRADLAGQFSSAGEAADAWVRLERLWRDQSMAHAREIFNAWSEARSGAPEPQRWRAVLRELRAAQTLRLAAERSPDDRSPERSRLLSYLDDMIKSLERDRARPERDLLAVGRTFLLSGSLPEALIQFETIAAYDLAGARWVLATQLLADDVRQSAGSIQREKTVLLANAIDVANRGEWLSARGMCEPLLDLPPYQRAARLIQAEALTRETLQRLDAARRSGDLAAVLEALRELEARAATLEHPAWRGLVDVDFSLGSLREEIVRAEHVLARAREAASDLGCLAETPSAARFDEAVTATKQVLARGLDQPNVRASLGTWACFALREGRNSEALAFAGAALSLGSDSSQIELFYRSALDRLSAERLAARGNYAAAFAVLGTMPRLDEADDPWLNQVRMQWERDTSEGGKVIAREVNSALSGIEQLAIAGNPAVPEKLREIEALLARWALLGVGTSAEFRGATRTMTALFSRYTTALESRKHDEQRNEEAKRQNLARDLARRNLAAARERLQSETVRAWRESLVLLEDSSSGGRPRSDGLSLTARLAGEIQRMLEQASALEANYWRAADERRWDDALLALNELGRIQVRDVVVDDSSDSGFGQSQRRSRDVTYRLNGFIYPDDFALARARGESERWLALERGHLESVLKCLEGMLSGDPGDGFQLAELKGEADALAPELRERVRVSLESLRSPQLVMPALLARTFSSFDLEPVARQAALKGPDAVSAQWQVILGSDSPEDEARKHRALNLLDVCVRAKQLAKGEIATQSQLRFLWEAEIIISTLMVLELTKSSAESAIPSTSLRGDLRSIKSRIDNIVWEQHQRTTSRGSSLVIQSSSSARLELAEAVKRHFDSWMGSTPGDGRLV